MRTTKIIGHAGILIVVLSLAMVTATGQQATTSIDAPPDEVQGQSFSVARGDPLTTAGVHPADILGVDGIPLVLCENLGMVCNDFTTDDVDDITGLSFGQDFTATGLPPLQFSVAAESRGLAGTAVRIEANCSPSQPQSDVFETTLDASNVQDLDGDGGDCGSNHGFGLGLTEDTTADNLDALARDPCQSIDWDCDGVPEQPLFLVLAPDSPTLAVIGASAADILMAGVEVAPLVWANGTTDLGLSADDVIDAICLQEDGNGVYDTEDQLLFSLAAGSPTLAALSAGTADLLRPSPPSVAVAAHFLGLEKTDNVNAITCTEVDLAKLYLPLIQR